MKRTDSPADAETGENPMRARRIFVEPLTSIRVRAARTTAARLPLVDGLTAAELRLAEQTWAGLPSFDVLAVRTLRDLSWGRRVR